MSKNIIQTELRFVGIIEKIDELQEELFDLGGEQNSLCDDCHDSICPSYVEGTSNYTPEAKARDAEIEKEADAIQEQLDEIQLTMGLNERQFDIMRESAITNRWEIYAQMKGAEIVSLVDIANGRV